MSGVGASPNASDTVVRATPTMTCDAPRDSMRRPIASSPGEIAIDERLVDDGLRRRRRVVERREVGPGDERNPHRLRSSPCVTMFESATIGLARRAGARPST